MSLPASRPPESCPRDINPSPGPTALGLLLFTCNLLPWSPESPWSPFLHYALTGPSMSQTLCWVRRCCREPDLELLMSRVPSAAVG